MSAKARCGGFGQISVLSPGACSLHGWAAFCHDISEVELLSHHSQWKGVKNEVVFGGVVGGESKELLTFLNG